MYQKNQFSPNSDEYKEQIREEIRNGEWDINSKKYDECPAHCLSPVYWEEWAEQYGMTVDQMYRVIPNGTHIHIKCPVHGSHRVDGPDYNWGGPDKERDPFYKTGYMN